jgi:aerobic carbon-monoxide dehydrogenase large subunit
LFERCAYDGGGQLVSGSFMDYAVARADDLPLFVTECDESQPCTHNPLGAKGCGEAGSIGAPAAVVSAALDALAGLGVTDLEMPLTPEQIWRRIGEYETVRLDLETRQPKPKKKSRRRRTNDGGGEKAT